MLFSDILSRLGLAENEAKIYEILLLKGETKARDLLSDSGLSRGNVYNMLTSLTARGLIQVIEGKQQTYKVTDPTKLSSLVEERKRGIERLDAEFKETLPRMLSTFSLTTGRPTVRVFEGLEGAEDAIMDSLDAKQGICTYLDLSSLRGDFADANARYLKKRIAKQIPKRIIVPDSQEAHDFFEKQNTPFTTVVFVKDFPTGFQTAMEMYNDTVSYLTMTPEKVIAVLIADRAIASLEQRKFDFLWKMFEPKD
ncbi:MAG: helix-turn-helix domain-containing protein [Patescibacteria group bacterium]|jgi:sugar-specific transcriptional regulator TrmB